MRSLIVALALLISTCAFAGGISVNRRAFPSVGGSTAQPSTWATNANTRAVWFLDENGSSNRVNAQGTSTRDLVAGASIANNTTDFKQGVASADPTGTTTSFLNCTDANCGGTTALDFTTTFTFGCWAVSDVTNNTRRIVSKGTTTTTANSTGYELTRNGSGDLQCWTGGSSVGFTTGTTPVSQWWHATCVYTGTQIQPYLNGKASGTLTSSTAPTDTAGAFTLGSRSDTRTANQGWSGRLDECFVIKANVGASSVCRIARCGMGGEFCVCDGGTPANYHTCITDADCKQYSQFGTCDTEAGSATVGKCAGRIMGTCAGGGNVNDACFSDADCPSSTCSPCSPVACNDAGP